MNRRRHAIVTIALIGMGTVAGLAQLKAPDQAAVDTYRSALRSAELAGGIRGIESAFTALTALRSAMLEVRNGKTVLESLPDEDFRRLQRGLRGALISREETVYVAPDVDYFKTLADARGDGADRAFCSALKTTYPASVWAVYVHQQTDYRGCTRFGSMSLVDTYRVWSDFQRMFPGRYTAGAKKEVDAVIDSLAGSTCACGDTAAVEQELQRFLRDFPTSAIRAKVEQRLEALGAGRSDIRTNCQGG
jgi:hypothetical protein